MENKELIEFVKERYFKKFPDHTLKQFKQDYEDYKIIPAFKADENINSLVTNYNDRDSLSDVEGEAVGTRFKMTPEIHWIIRMATQYYLTKAFEAMKVDLNDPNIAETQLGRGTPGRISKLWVGGSLDDDSELGSGRFCAEPYIACFPNTEHNKSIITKEVEIVSTCSHHFLPFSTFGGGKAIIKYVPGNFILGISKISRYVKWLSRRFYLQEQLTEKIGKEMKRIAATEDVYVRLEGLKHSCEVFRGAEQQDSSLTTEFKSGIFEENIELCR